MSSTIVPSEISLSSYPDRETKWVMGVYFTSVRCPVRGWVLASAKVDDNGYASCDVNIDDSGCGYVYITQYWDVYMLFVKDHRCCCAITAESPCPASTINFYLDSTNKIGVVGAIERLRMKAWPADPVYSTFARKCAEDVDAKYAGAALTNEKFRSRTAAMAKKIIPEDNTQTRPQITP